MNNYYLTITCNEIHHQPIFRFLNSYNEGSKLIVFTVDKLIYSGIIQLKHTSKIPDHHISFEVDRLMHGLTNHLNDEFYGGTVYIDHHIRKDLVVDIILR
jgi:hypothetical protein